MIPLALIVTAAGGALLNAIVSRDVAVPDTAQVPVTAGAHAFLEDEQARRAHQSFQQGVAMLQAGRFEHAVTALHEVLAIYLLGAGEAAAATDFFHSATDLRPSLHNAYYGLALAERELGNDEGALAAMQAYTHLADDGERHLPRAKEIIWELQAETGGR
jgi:tetratricopeptide (TPR) repeat protein